MSAAVAVVVLAGAAIAGTRLLGDGGSGQSTADEPYYGTTAELEGSADAIVRGTLTATRPDADETVATVQVSSIAKGSVAAGAAIEVAYSASGPETPEGLHRGGDFVLLLQVRDGKTWNLVNTTQGYYTVAGANLTPGPDNDVPLSASVTQRLGMS
ncbi:hypothetical protein [Paractinoplanes durhamensis]|uniref:hypothetical protein n=1 Tax=Paractinoplanes durhamensis TaxID=113563 RepID=UPI0019435787|nr:hypothetical protein [Actinoplanes durhamensis]